MFMRLQAPRSRWRPVPRKGLTLVELMVSMMIMVVGIFAMVSTAGTVMKQTGAGQQQTLAATAGQSRLEQLRALGCNASSLTSGSASGRGISERWTVSADNGPNTAVTFILLTDSVRYVSNGAAKWKVFTSVRPC